MQLVCNGIALDLYEGTGLQFKKTNPAFAFGTMSAERTTNFKLPATPTNDRVFECAKIPAYSGGAMRKKFDATLIDGIVVMNGFLYVASFDGKDYNAIFVGGLAYDLQKWTNADWGRLNLTPAYVPDTAYDANVGGIPIVARVSYYHASGTLRPSVNISQLFAQLNSQNMFKISGMTGSALRLIRKIRYDIEDAVVSLVNGANARDYDLDLSTSSDLVTVEQAMFVGVDGQGYDIFAKCFVTPNVCRITFPDDTPENLCICYNGWATGPLDSVAFLGSRKFVYDNGQVVYTGAPLAGQTIEIIGTHHIQLNKQKFVLMDANGATWNGAYFKFNNYMEYVQTYNVKVKISSENYTNSTDTPTLSMLQGLSLGDLLKMYAACNGLLINVKTDGSVQFLSAFSGSDAGLDVMEQSEVKRTFADYAQRNRLQFKESESVYDSERVFGYYTIPNDNIEESKDLLTINASEGGQEEHNPNLVYVRGDEDVLAKQGNNTSLMRASIVKNAMLQALCTQSTQVKMKARMDMYTFSLIDSTTTFNYKGTRYSWTDAVWSNNVAQFTLAKIE